MNNELTDLRLISLNVISPENSVDDDCVITDTWITDIRDVDFTKIIKTVTPCSEELCKTQEELNKEYAKDENSALDSEDKSQELKIKLKNIYREYEIDTEVDKMFEAYKNMIKKYRS